MSTAFLGLALFFAAPRPELVAPGQTEEQVELLLKEKGEIISASSFYGALYPRAKLHVVYTVKGKVDRVEPLLDAPPKK